MIIKKTKYNLNKKAVINVIMLLAIFYFTFHAVYGERGIISYFKLQAKLEKQHQKLAETRAKRLEIENRTKLLRDESIDKDMLDEKIRSILGFSDQNEKIIKLKEIEGEEKLNESRNFSK